MTNSSSALTTLPMPSPGRLRWQIAFLASAAIAISYLDRQTLPVAIHAIQKDIPISNEDFSLLNTAFLVMYGVTYAAGGKLVDVFGTRSAFMWIMIFWSLACASHGIARNMTMLAGSRLLLGVGEGGSFPAATRAVAQSFPAEERSSAMGIINGGTALGALVAPALIAAILGFTNWRAIFFLTGGLGLVWTFFWWRMSFQSEQHPVSDEVEHERPLVTSSSPSGGVKEMRWCDLIRFRETRGLVAAKFLSDAAWYFYLFWLPKYLYDARGFDIKAVGMFAWLPYAASGVGCLCGGWLSSHLMTKGHSINLARKAALGASVAVMPLIALVTHVPVAWAIALFCIAFFGQQSWSTLVMVLPADLFPENNVGSVAGLVGFGGAMGGVIFGQCVGWLLDHGFGYSLVFCIAATFHVVAFIVICLTVPIIRPLSSYPSIIE
jgi:MFS transporter, ACS family, hexuronate transporter